MRLAVEKGGKQSVRLMYGVEDQCEHALSLKQRLSDRLKPPLWDRLGRLMWGDLWDSLWCPERQE